MGFVIRYPSHFEQDQPLIEARGWLEGVVIEAGGLEYHPVSCDEPRLAQEIHDALAADASPRAGRPLV
jgi:hypothetical protein